jgi:hypothetical protein
MLMMVFNHDIVYNMDGDYSTKDGVCIVYFVILFKTSNMTLLLKCLVYMSVVQREKITLSMVER